MLFFVCLGEDLRIVFVEVVEGVSGMCYGMKEVGDDVGLCELKSWGVENVRIGMPVRHAMLKIEEVGVRRKDP